MGIAGLAALMGLWSVCTHLRADSPTRHRCCGLECTAGRILRCRCDPCRTLSLQSGRAVCRGQRRGETLALAAARSARPGEGLNPGEPTEDNLYELTPEEFAERGIEELPTTLQEAVGAFPAHPFVTAVLGQGLRDGFITYKSEEWRQYHQRVSQWEIDTYARLF